MASIIVDQEAAKSILDDAYSSMNNYQLTATVQSQIDHILSAANKTDTYILITELLAKSTNEKVNTIALQAKAEVEGAFDARSLCHKVIVTNPKVNLLLGNSTEPFINNPARDKTLISKERFKSSAEKINRGELVSLLQSVSTDVEAADELRYCLHFLYNRVQQQEQDQKYLMSEILRATAKENASTALLAYYKKVLHISCEGESLILCLYTALKKHLKSLHIKTVAHASNESGASGREIEDIDLFYFGKPICCLELKDKKFDVPDVKKSIEKMVAHKVKTLLFVKGNNGSFIGDKDMLDGEIEAANKIGVTVVIIDAFELLAILVALTPKINLKYVFRNGLKEAKKIKAKEKTIENWKKSAIQ